MKKITAFQTDDGKIFDDEDEAVDHEAETDMRKAVTELVDSECYAGMNEKDIINFIMECAGDFREIFS